ncbi:MAG TPA: aminotransferase class III-fold pyridoxal phosphate-dependent enzyme, partial [Arenicellales bacterium]|nr:aminotransferase class III-fold pyridoxal phosphate-dependent enzyme [Arenicellales bacterium]
MQRQVIESRYRELTASSACAFSEAKRWLPGGCSRQAGFWHPYPLTFARGETCYLWDLDGRRYIDLLGNYTALVHGHAYPPIVA